MLQPGDRHGPSERRGAANVESIMKVSLVDDVFSGKAHRILVLGSCGSGKTYLAKRLAAASALPLVHLDDLYWGPGWTRPAPEDFRAAVREAARRERWIIDGNYAATIADRLERAQLVIWLDFPTATCLASVLARDARRALGERESLPAGVQEGGDHPPTSSGRWAFYKHVIGFRRDVRPRVLHELDAAGVPVLRLKSRRAAARLVTHPS